MYGRRLSIVIAEAIEVLTEVQSLCNCEKVIVVSLIRGGDADYSLSEGCKSSRVHSKGLVESSFVVSSAGHSCKGDGVDQHIDNSGCVESSGREVYVEGQLRSTRLSLCLKKCTDLLNIMFFERDSNGLLPRSILPG